MQSTKYIDVRFPETCSIYFRCLSNFVTPLTFATQHCRHFPLTLCGDNLVYYKISHLWLFPLRCRTVRLVLCHPGNYNGLLYDLHTNGSIIYAISKTSREQICLNKDYLICRNPYSMYSQKLQKSGMDFKNKIQKHKKDNDSGAWYNAIM